MKQKLSLLLCIAAFGALSAQGQTVPKKSAKVVAPKILAEAPPPPPAAPTPPVAAKVKTHEKFVAPPPPPPAPAKLQAHEKFVAPPPPPVPPAAPIAPVKKAIRHN